MLHSVTLRNTPKLIYESGGQEFESLRARHLTDCALRSTILPPRTAFVHGAHPPPLAAVFTPRPNLSASI